MSLGITMELELPRDDATVPAVRHILRTTLDEIGVTEEAIGDVELAVTEACANVIEHAHGEDDYHVRVVVTARECEIHITDAGRGFQGMAEDFPPGDVEHGRGLLIMEALMDSLTFRSQPDAGTAVHLTKTLHFSEAPLL